MSFDFGLKHLQLQAPHITRVERLGIILDALQICPPRCSPLSLSLSLSLSSFPLSSSIRTNYYQDQHCRNMKISLTV